MQGSPGRVMVLDRAVAVLGRGVAVLDRAVAAAGVEGPWHNLRVHE